MPDSVIVSSACGELRIESVAKSKGTASISAFYKNSLIPQSKLDDLPIEKHSIQGIAAYFVIMKHFLIKFLTDQNESDQEKIIQEIIADITPAK